MPSELRAHDARVALYGPRYRFAEDAAMRSVGHLAGDIHERRSPFYSDVEMALRCDAKIRMTQLPVPGDIIPRLDSGYWIRINERDSRERQRFTVCHEIGHILFQTTAMFPEQFSHPLQQRYNAAIEERICDKIATALLMPAEVYRREARALPVSLDSLAELAQTFWVTRDAAFVRLLELRPWRCAWAQWLNDGSGDAIRPVWWSPRHSPDADIERDTVFRCLRAVGASATAARRSGAVERQRLSGGWTVESIRLAWRGRQSVMSMFRHTERLAPWIPTDAI